MEIDVLAEAASRLFHECRAPAYATLSQKTGCSVIPAEGRHTVAVWIDGSWELNSPLRFGRAGTCAWTPQRSTSSPRLGTRCEAALLAGDRWSTTLS